MNHVRPHYKNEVNSSVGSSVQSTKHRKLDTTTVLPYKADKAHSERDHESERSSLEGHTYKDSLVRPWYKKMIPFPPAPAPVTRGATQPPGSAGGGKKGRPPPARPPPGISGTVASLVISPDWFAAKEENKRERFWWSPGM